MLAYFPQTLIPRNNPMPNRCPNFVMAFAQFAMNFHAKPNELENLLFIEKFVHLRQFVQISAIRVKYAPGLP